MDMIQCMGRIIERKRLRNALLAACGRKWLRLAATPAKTTDKGSKRTGRRTSCCKRRNLVAGDVNCQDTFRELETWKICEVEYHVSHGSRTEALALACWLCCELWAGRLRVSERLNRQRWPSFIAPALYYTAPTVVTIKIQACLQGNYSLRLPHSLYFRSSDAH